MPSYPSVSSPKDDSNNFHGTARNSCNTRGQSFMRKKLERQRKLRHVSDQELGLNLTLTDRPNSPPADPDSAKKSWSPGGADHWSSVAVPHPLPVPESLLTRKRELLGSVLTLVIDNEPVAQDLGFKSPPCNQERKPSDETTGHDCKDKANQPFEYVLIRDNKFE
ncbi:hypothetical protein H0E87_004732 [Populus deltoides]|uniref:Uncharacterized protein n=1 Tax=Populus deltoides TaxID=3696 RepID=A0A8T2ZGN7_POPDE|nr:hypothetical protein H0E87_004732 [Populus deltoides]